MPTLRHTVLASALALIIASTAHAAEDPAPPAPGGESTAAPGEGDDAGKREKKQSGHVADTAGFGLFGNRAHRDMPHAAISYTADWIADRQADGLADALANDPAMRAAQGWSDFQQIYVIRGFPLDADDLTFNGLAGLVPARYVAVESFDRIEVLRGANAALNGAGPAGTGIGGGINLASKRAPSGGIRRATLGLQNGGETYAAADVGHRFGASEAWGVRLNGVRRDGEGAIDAEERRLSSASIGVDFAGTAVRFGIDAVVQDRRVDAPRPDVAARGHVPRPPAASSSFAQPWTYLDERDEFGTARVEIDLGNRALAWLGVGARASDRHGVVTFNVVEPGGALSGTPSFVREESEAESIEAGVSVELQAAHGVHRLTLEAADVSVERRASRLFLGFDTGTGRIDAPIALPRPFELSNGLPSLLGFDPAATSERRSIALFDEVSLRDGRVLAMVGVRHQQLGAPIVDPLTGIALGVHSDTALTPTVGFVAHRSDRVSIYGNYAEAIEPTAAPGLADSENLSPLRSRQFELGLKYDTGRFGATAALFHIIRPGLIFTPTRISEDGKQRNVGIEVGASGEVAAGLRVLGGLTLLDAEQVRTQDGALDGRDVVGVPERLANLDVEWDVPSVAGLTLDARVAHTGSQPGDPADTVEAKAWTRWDLGARYRFDAGRVPVTVRVRVENVADTSYWQSVGGYPGAYNLVLAAPRTVNVAAAFDF